MELLKWNGQPLSRMMLGTVQFGMPYGIANRSGQPEYSEVLSILKEAIDGGVNALDTAAAYGTSEEVLGRALRELGVADRMFVVTKVRPLTPEELSNPEAAGRAIEESVHESRRRLRLDRLPGVLFHREADGAFVEALVELRRRGFLEHAGVSCNNFPGPAEAFVRSGNVSALQIPGNILDRRHQQSGIFRLAEDRGIGVYLRSVYLQGLLVMPEGEIPPHLAEIIPARRRLQSVGDGAGLSLGELSLRYMLSQRGVTSILTGVENVEQVRGNLAAFAAGPLGSDLVEAIDSLALEVPEDVMTPSTWSNPSQTR